MQERTYPVGSSYIKLYKIQISLCTVLTFMIAEFATSWLEIW